MLQYAKKHQDINFSRTDEGQDSSVIKYCPNSSSTRMSNLHCTTNHTHPVRQQRRKELLEGADIDSAHTNETVILVSATTNKQETLLDVLIYIYKTITAKGKNPCL